jgi:hypothetical protein
MSRDIIGDWWRGKNSDMSKKEDHTERKELEKESSLSKYKKKLNEKIQNEQPVRIEEE